MEVIKSNYSFLARPDAEYDGNYLQIIPYTVIIRGRQIFMLKRLNAQTESRLHGLLSIGAGGHINPDATVVEAYQTDISVLEREKMTGAWTSIDHALSVKEQMETGSKLSIDIIAN